MLFKKPIEILEAWGLIDWNVLLVGFERKLVTKSDIINFAVKSLQDSSGEYNKYISLLAGAEDCKEDELKYFLEQLICSTIDNDYECLEKWLLVELIVLADSTSSPEDKIERLQEIYANYDYPSYMKNCCKYGPSQYAIDNGLASCDELTTCPLEEMKKVISFLKNKFGICK